MGKPWVILARRFGGDTRSPTFCQLAEAARELYHETYPDMSEEDYAEHGAASLRYGLDVGPMYVLEADRLHNVTFEEWADQGYEQEIAPPRKMRQVPEEFVVRLWSLLAEGRIDEVRSQPWMQAPGDP